MTFAVIPADVPDLSALTKYVSSETMSRYFCPTCGASVVNVENLEGGGIEWEFATGVLDRTERLLNRVQIFVEDTHDGGAAGWLADAVPEMHRQHRKSPAMTTADVEVLKVEEPSQGPIVAQCHCGDVSFQIAPGKYPAGLDACTSCRLVSGFEITCWATIPQKHITTAGGPFNLNSPALKNYKSSQDVDRYFCARCGALVFYYKSGRDTIDVGVGLLRASGASAEEVLTWEKYEDCVAYPQDAIDAPLVKMLAEKIQKSRLDH